MLTDQDIEKLKTIFATKEEFKAEMERQFFEFKTEIVQAFTAKEESMAHAQMLLDHEGRIRFIEKCLEKARGR